MADLAGVTVPIGPKRGLIYEIKPDGSQAEGENQLEEYLLALELATEGKIPWVAGSLADYRPPSMLVVMGKRVIISGPINGVIIYRVDGDPESPMNAMVYSALPAADRNFFERAQKTILITTTAIIAVQIAKIALAAPAAVRGF